MWFDKEKFVVRIYRNLNITPSYLAEGVSEIEVIGLVEKPKSPYEMVVNIPMDYYSAIAIPTANGLNQPADLEEPLKTLIPDIKFSGIKTTGIKEHGRSLYKTNILISPKRTEDDKIPETIEELHLPVSFVNPKTGKVVFLELESTIKTEGKQIMLSADLKRYEGSIALSK